MTSKGSLPFYTCCKPEQGPGTAACAQLACFCSIYPTSNLLDNLLAGQESEGDGRTLVESTLRAAAAFICRVYLKHLICLLTGYQAWMAERQTHRLSMFTIRTVSSDAPPEATGYPGWQTQTWWTSLRARSAAATQTPSWIGTGLHQ